MELADRVAIVTGASSGIGLAVARMLVAAGARVAMVARGLERLQRVCDELGPKAIAFPLDVGDLAAVARLPADVVAKLGRLDIVVNNAGVHHRGDMLRHPADKLATMFTVNLVAPVVITRTAADVMPAGSVVVNVASLAGKLGVPGSAVYSGTKAGLRLWALAASDDLERRGIRIGNVNPGPVDTGFFDDDFDNVSALTFSQPMVTPEAVAERVMQVIHSDRTALDLDIPYTSGKLATISYLVPGLGRLLRPMLERKGAKAKARYAERRGQLPRSGDAPR
ncbi:MAG: SDR family oxidoreductase [Nannocystaceae bacterium]|nr:SDR family oxidoreductase [Nannocystaceae bacterium]